MYTVHRPETLVICTERMWSYGSDKNNELKKKCIFFIMGKWNYIILRANESCEMLTSLPSLSRPSSMPHFFPYVSLIFFFLMISLPEFLFQAHKPLAPIWNVTFNVQKYKVQRTMANYMVVDFILYNVRFVGT